MTRFGDSGGIKADTRAAQIAEASRIARSPATGTITAEASKGVS